MSAAWQDALVVRSADGVLWLRTSSTEWPWRRRFDHTQATHDGLIVKDVDPTPVLDSEGLPTVRTVGDLTARHIGKRVRVGDGAGVIEGRLLNIEHDKRTTDVAIAEGDQDVADWWPAGPRDTPCEVLP